MEIEIIDLPVITIIGKEGLCTTENNVVQQLWQEANSNFNEVATLGMKNPDGTYVGFWGAMSDESKSFRPWTHQFTRGLYLAGIETYADAIAPEGCWGCHPKPAFGPVHPHRPFVHPTVTVHEYKLSFSLDLVKNL